METSTDRLIEVRCKTCQWFDNHAEDAEDHGLCRARPPVAQESGTALWPVTHDNDWCRKHEPDHEEKIDSGQYRRMPDGRLAQNSDWRPYGDGD